MTNTMLHNSEFVVRYGPIAFEFSFVSRLMINSFMVGALKQFIVYINIIQKVVKKMDFVCCTNNSLYGYRIFYYELIMIETETITYPNKEDIELTTYI